MTTGESRRSGARNLSFLRFPVQEITTAAMLAALATRHAGVRVENPFRGG